MGESANGEQARMRVSQAQGEGRISQGAKRARGEMAKGRKGHNFDEYSYSHS